MHQLLIKMLDMQVQYRAKGRAAYTHLCLLCSSQGWRTFQDCIQSRCQRAALQVWTSPGPFDLVTMQDTEPPIPQADYRFSRAGTSSQLSVLMMGPLEHSVYSARTEPKMGSRCSCMLDTVNLSTFSGVVLIQNLHLEAVFCRCPQPYQPGSCMTWLSKAGVLIPESCQAEILPLPGR